MRSWDGDGEGEEEGMSWKELIKEERVLGMRRGALLFDVL